MKHNIKDCKTYKIHHYKYNKFKTIDIKLIFRKPIKKEDITKTNLLFDVLFGGTKYHPTDKSINIRKEELYGINIGTNCKRIGNYFQVYLNLEVLNDKYTEKNNLEESIKLFSEIILDPLLKDNSFDKDIVNREKHIYKDYYKNIKENPVFYSYIRGNEEYNKDSVLSYRQVGYIEELDNINESNLYDFYKEFIKTNQVDIIVIGNIEFNNIVELINKYFNRLKCNIKYENNYYLEDKLLNKNIIKKEKINNKQSTLLMIYRTDNINKFEREYVLKIFSSILGESSNSKLFNTIREEKSLCYYINSYYNTLDNTIYIVSGIDKSNYELTVTEIKNIINNINTIITEEDITKEKNNIKIHLDNQLNNNFKISNYLEQIDIYKKDTIETRIDNYNKITKEDILNAVKKLNLESIFLLEGEYHEEN